MIDINNLIEPIDGDTPCGGNLEDEASFYALEELTKGKPEQAMGDSLKPAEPPEWKKVEKQAADFYTKTKDLRITMWLINALLNNDGFSGLKKGFNLLHSLIEKYWDTLYPELDPTDANPALERNSCLMSLNEDSFLRAIMTTPLVQSKALGTFSFRDVEIASGNLKPASGETEPPKMTTIEASFVDDTVTVEALQEVAEGLSGALEQITATDKLLETKVGEGNGPNINQLLDLLKKVEKFLGEQLLRRGIGVEENPVKEQEAGEGVNVNAGSAVAAHRMAGVISSREDVIQALEKICAYYNQHEPSSPVPLLLHRAKLLVPKSFMEVLEDLIPESAKTASGLLKSLEENT